MFRVNDWWQGKAALLMGMVYLFVCWFHIPFILFVQLALASIVTISGFASLGYLLNDLFDIQKDLKAGKPNTLHGKPVAVVIVLFAVAIAALFLPWLYLPYNKVSVGLIAAEIATFVLYAAPPVRLKERGLAGVVADALYAHSLPVLLAAYTFMLASGTQANVWLLLVLLVMQTISGVRNIVIHQYQDAEADRLAGTSSFFAKLNTTQFSYTVLTCIVSEVVLLSLFFGLLSRENSLLLICQPVIWLYTLVMALLFMADGLPAFLKSRWRYFPNNLLELWLPVVILLVLAVTDSRFIPVALVHLLLFNYKFYVEVYNRGLVPVRGQVKEVCVRLLVNMRYALSFVVNYAIYCGFMVFGVDLKKEKVSAMEYLRRQRKAKQG